MIGDFIDLSTQEKIDERLKHLSQTCPAYVKALQMIQYGQITEKTGLQACIIVLAAQLESATRSLIEATLKIPPQDVTLEDGSVFTYTGPTKETK